MKKTGACGMSRKNRNWKKFHAHTAIRWTVFENYYLFVHGARIAQFRRLKNMLRVGINFCQRLCNVISSDNLCSSQFILTESLGPEYGEMQILDLEATWVESEPRTPLVCILSIGSDPTSQIATLAKNKNIGKNY